MVYWNRFSGSFVINEGTYILRDINARIKNFNLSSLNDFIECDQAGSGPDNRRQYFTLFLSFSNQFYETLHDDIEQYLISHFLPENPVMTIYKKKKTFGNRNM